MHSVAQCIGKINKRTYRERYYSLYKTSKQLDQEARDRLSTLREELSCIDHYYKLLRRAHRKDDAGFGGDDADSGSDDGTGGYDDSSNNGSNLSDDSGGGFGGTSGSYNEDEPRVSAGNGRESGEWTNGGGSTGSSNDNAFSGIAAGFSNYLAESWDALFQGITNFPSDIGQIETDLVNNPSEGLNELFGQNGYLGWIPGDAAMFNLLASTPTALQEATALNTLADTTFDVGIAFTRLRICLTRRHSR